MLKPLYVLSSLGALALRRIISQPGLTILALIGIVFAVGLVTSAGFFAQAVDRVILTQELAELSRTTGRIPFSTRVYFLPSSRKPVDVDLAEDLGRSIVGTLTDEIGLPLEHLGLQVGSGGMMLLPQEGDVRYNSSKSFLTNVNLVYVADVAQRIDIVSGDSFGAPAPSADGALDIWMHTDLAEEMGIQAGEKFYVAVNLSQPRQPIRVRGLWRASDPQDRFWFTDPDATLRTGLLVARDDYVRTVEPLLAAKSGLVAWHIILDEARLNPKYAADYAAGFERGMAIVDRYLPGARLDVSPLDSLKQFVLRQSALTLVLLGFNVPAFGFLLYFLVLVSLIIARWQGRETALLVSRGMGLPVVLGLTLCEEAFLFVVGLPLGILFGMQLAGWMGFTDSFLSFAIPGASGRPPLPVSLQGVHYGLITVALGVALSTRLLPMVAAARRSVVVQAREQARPLRPPFWQRAYLDLILIIPTYYAYDQLAQRGSLALRAHDTPEEFFRDPLLVLVPGLFILTAALLTMRVFPWLMHLFDLVAGRTPWFTLHIALRQLGRSSQSYVNPLLLVIVALALGVYTRSLAASLDQWLVDRIYYRVGADVTFEPFSEEAEAAGLAAGLWMPPAGDFAQLPGVAAATRVGDYPLRVYVTADQEVRGRFLGIDRVDFANVAWFRRDLASESLGALMNRLATAPDNVLVAEQVLQDTGLRIGDKLNMKVNLDDDFSYVGLFTIAGVYEHFPTVEAEDVAVVGNLDHLFDEVGSIFPHAIWLRTASGTTNQELVTAVRRQGVEPSKLRNAQALVAAERSRMERVGIFGTLSVGFLAATVMAILALLIHSYASMQERLFQFGVLRAMGLMKHQVVAQVALEYGLLTAYGAVAGAAIGLLAAQVFAPYFRIPDTAGAPLPPLIPLIAREESLHLAMVFVAIMVLMEVLVLARALSTRLFDTLRMGHQG